MNKRIIVIVVGLLVVAGGVYKFVLTGGAPPVKEKKNIEGVLLPLDKEFMINLSGGQIAKVNIALLLDEKDPAAALAAAAEGGGPIPAHPQNAAIRSVITSTLMESSAAQLQDPNQRKGLLVELKANLEKQTDAKVKAVLITDVIVS